MAEFCFKCFQKYFDEDVKESNLVISGDLELCEGCTEFKPVVVCYICYKRPKTMIDRIKDLLK